jgi:hypothetical protein
LRASWNGCWQNTGDNAPAVNPPFLATRCSGPVCKLVASGVKTGAAREQNPGEATIQPSNHSTPKTYNCTPAGGFAFRRGQC